MTLLRLMLGLLIALRIATAYVPDAFGKTIATDWACSYDLPGVGRGIGTTGDRTCSTVRPRSALVNTRYRSDGFRWKADGSSGEFTGKERDAETGLDYFGARYFSAAQGRFTSPDPTFMTKDRITDPQQWNLYAYTRNNPLKYVDPDGRELKLAIYNSGLPTSAATRAADTIAAKFRQAGVKNVTYDLRSGSPSLWQTFRYQILPTPNSHLFEMRAGRAGEPAIRAGEGGHNWGGQSAVDASVVTSRTKVEGQVATGVANMGTHEVAHDVLGHVDSPTNIMHSSGAADPSWLANPNLVFTPEQARALQQKYNKPGEVDRTLPRPPKRKEEEERQ